MKKPVRAPVPGTSPLLTTHVSKVLSWKRHWGLGRRDPSLFPVPRRSAATLGRSRGSRRAVPLSPPPQVSAAQPRPSPAPPLRSRRPQTPARPHPGSCRCPGMATPLLILLLCGGLCPPARAGLHFRAGQSCYRPAPRRAPGLRSVRLRSAPGPRGGRSVGKGQQARPGSGVVRGAREGGSGCPGLSGGGSGCPGMSGGRFGVPGGVRGAGSVWGGGGGHEISVSERSRRGHVSAPAPGGLAVKLGEIPACFVWFFLFGWFFKNFF